MTEEIKSKYFAETAIALRREGFQIEQLQNCTFCARSGNCALQTLAEDYNLRGTGFSHKRFFGEFWSLTTLRLTHEPLCWKLSGPTPAEMRMY